MSRLEFCALQVWTGIGLTPCSCWLQDPMSPKLGTAQCCCKVNRRKASKLSIRSPVHSSHVELLCTGHCQVSGSVTKPKLRAALGCAEAGVEQIHTALKLSGLPSHTRLYKTPDQRLRTQHGGLRDCGCFHRTVSRTGCPPNSEFHQRKPQLESLMRKVKEAKHLEASKIRRGLEEWSLDFASLVRGAHGSHGELDTARPYSSSGLGLGSKPP